MGVSPVFVRFAEVGPFASAFWRAALALPFLFLWMQYEVKKSGEPLHKFLKFDNYWPHLHPSGSRYFLATSSENPLREELF